MQLISREGDSKPNTRKKNVSNKKVSQNKKKFIKKITGKGFGILK